MRKAILWLALAAAVVAVSVTSCAHAQSITEYPVTLQPIVHVEDVHFLDLQPLRIDNAVKQIWRSVEQCAGFERDISEVTFYYATAIFAEEKTPEGRTHLGTLWGIYFDSPPEIVVTPTDIRTSDMLFAVIRHEITHHFAGVSGDSHEDHEVNPLFLRCSGEETP